MTDSNDPACVLTMTPGTWAMACVRRWSPRSSMVARSTTSACAAISPMLSGALLAVTCTRAR